MSCEALWSWILAPWGQAGAPGSGGGPAQGHRQALSPLKSKVAQLAGAAAPGKGLSSPLEMGCDLLQGLSFGLRDTGQSEKDAEDTEGGGEPESTVGPEHLLQREGKPRVTLAEGQGPSCDHQPGSQPAWPRPRAEHWPKCGCCMPGKLRLTVKK